MKKSITLIAFALATTAQAFDLSVITKWFTPTSLTHSVLVDMTGSTNKTGYKKAAIRVTQSAMRQARAGDRLAIYRICRKPELVASFPVKNKLSDDELVRFSAAAVQPCNDRGSGIVKALKRVRNQKVITVFTDGGLVDDPLCPELVDPKVQVCQAFRREAELASQRSSVVFIAGLSQFKRGGATLRDSLVHSLPASNRIITAGMVDELRNFAQFSDRVMKARK